MMPEITTDDRVLVEHSHAIMGTRADIHIAVSPGAEAAGARAAIEDCFAWLREVDSRLTRFDAASELCRLNAAAGEWRAVSPVLFDAIEQSVAAAVTSGGLFDPTLLPLLEALGYDRDYAAIAQREARTEWRVRHDVVVWGGWRAIELDRAGGRVRLPTGTRLDFGGIAKGWAADVALERFFASYPDVIVNVGGDLRARGGPQAGDPWPLGVASMGERPRGEETAHEIVLTLGRGGMATSGAASRWWYSAGERQHHLLDPRTGLPMPLWIDAEDDRAAAGPLIASATALAPTAAHAEVAAKVALLRGYPAALRAVEDAWTRQGAAEPEPYGDADVALLLVLGTGEVACSANLQAYLDTLGGGGHVWVD